MRNKISFLILLCFLLPFSDNLVQGQVRLPALVGDHMVLQRDEKIKIWGWAEPGEKVKVRFLGKSYRSAAEKDGSWQIWLPSIEAGGPYTMQITASNNITIHDIMIGDVWLCSGQSNMVHYLDRHSERYANEIAEADYPAIRQFLVPLTPDLTAPKSDFRKTEWKVASPETIGEFTVVGYFFALKLFKEYGIPIGIINSSVGGTPIEAWTSEKGLKAFQRLQETIEKNKDTAYVNGVNREAAEARKKAWKKPEDQGLNGPVKWSDPGYQPKNWHPINIPGYWEDQGIRDLDGVVWYRREIIVPATMTGVQAKIALGRIVDSDELYINGTKVGGTGYQYPQRRYTVDEGILKPGKNLLVIRVSNNFGKGGFVPDKPYYLATAKDTIDLKGTWQYRVGEVFVREGGYVRSINAQNEPAALFNGMISPATGYGIKGVLWYQGESNAGRPLLYKEYLPALIADWRDQWKKPSLPFLVVQLPNFMEVNYLPEESNWALLREAQLEALNISNTGLIVTIDLGEWNDIHPGRKKPVGERAALEAMRVAYGEKEIVSTGPIFTSQEIEGNKIILHFDNIGSGLVSGNGEPLAHFAIAGDDKKFRWGTAIIKNNTVVVWHDDIADPKYIRYAWADNPRFANLYNKEGLPASPFRTDQ